MTARIWIAAQERDVGRIRIAAIGDVGRTWIVAK
jgi:hypothetical protein